MGLYSWLDKQLGGLLPGGSSPQRAVNTMFGYETYEPTPGVAAPVPSSKPAPMTALNEAIGTTYTAVDRTVFQGFLPGGTPPPDLKEPFEKLGKTLLLAGVVVAVIALDRK